MSLLTRGLTFSLISNQSNKKFPDQSKLFQSSFLPSSSLLNLYYSLIHPHLLYGLPIWVSTYSTYLEKLCTLQNKAVIIINKGCYEDLVSPFYSNLKIFKMTDFFKLEIAKIVLSHFQKNFLNYFLIFFQDKQHFNKIN